MKKQRRRVGDVVQIDLGKGYHSYGRILEEPLMAFYNIRTKEHLALESIVNKPIAFMVWVMNYAVTDGDWAVIGNMPIDNKEHPRPRFYKKDSTNKKLTITTTGDDETPATKDDCRNLECAAVWEPEHIVDRLNDMFAGRPNIWVESMKP